MPLLGHRLFFALRPSRSACEAMAEYRNCYRHAGDSVVSDRRLHVTLAVTPLVDRIDAQAVDHLRAIGAQVALDPFPILFDRISCWRGEDGRGSLMLRPSQRTRAMRSLSRALSQPLCRSGLLRPGWRFDPHATLLYGRTAPFETEVLPVCWGVDSFVLIHSLVGESRHLEYGRWPLRSNQLAFAFD